MNAYSQEYLGEHFQRVYAEVDAAARLAGRASSEINVVAVSKFHPAEAVLALARLGQRDFGENYLQEAHAKRLSVEKQALGMNPALHVRWHAIGPIQTNKAKEVAGCFHLVHTVASLRLAEAISRRLPPGTEQAILLQVNIGEEAQKAGLAMHELFEVAEAVAQVPGLSLQGLMCLPPFFDDGEAARPYFARLRTLRDELEKRLLMPLPHLSMGMSGDFAAAISEGATMVRIGTAFFGERPGAASR